MRVLMVSKALVSAAYHGKLREMVKLGVDLTLVVPPRWGNQPLEVLQASDYAIRVLPCALSGYNHFHFYTRPIGDLSADLAYIEEEPWSLVTWQFMRHCVRQQVPTVFFTWQNIRKRYLPPFDAIERFTYRHARAAIAGNQEASEIMLERGFQRPIVVIPQFGVDPTFFTRHDAQLVRSRLRVANQFVVGYVGRIVAEKGIADLIRALPRLPRGCVLLMIGDGSYRRQAQQIAHRIGVAERIRWVPRVRSVDVPDYLSAMDALVLPSRTTPRWKEQFGRVLVEAMACGTPPVGSSSAEIPNVISNAGLIFPEGDVEALASRIAMLFENPRLVAEIAAKGRTRVLQNFTHAIIAAKSVELFSTVLSARAEIVGARVSVCS